MAETKSAAEQFAEQQAKEAISQRYIDPMTLDPDRQDQIDKNRVPGEFGADASLENTATPAPDPIETTFSGPAAGRPLDAILAVAVIGFVAVLIWR